MLCYILSVNMLPSPGLNGSVPLTGRASGLIGIVDMFGFENSQVCHSSAVGLTTMVNGPSKTKILTTFSGVLQSLFFQYVLSESRFFEKLRTSQSPGSIVCFYD